MVFQPGDHDFITFTDILPSPTLGNKVDALGGATDKDNYVYGRRIEEVADFTP